MGVGDCTWTSKTRVLDKKEGWQELTSGFTKPPFRRSVSLDVRIAKKQFTMYVICAMLCF